MTKYGNKDYHNAMNNLIDQVDGLVDAQIKLDNYYSYSHKYMQTVARNLRDTQKWRVPLKWSTKVSNNCLADEEKVLEEMRKVTRAAKDMNANFTKLAETFGTNANKDYAKFDCDAMYPVPVQHKVDIMKTLMDAGKEGLQIFNEVKGMLPEGTMSKLKIPGLPPGTMAKVTDGV